MISIIDSLEALFDAKYWRALVRSLVDVVNRYLSNIIIIDQSYCFIGWIIFITILVWYILTEYYFQNNKNKLSKQKKHSVTDITKAKENDTITEEKVRTTNDDKEPNDIVSPALRSFKKCENADFLFSKSDSDEPLTVEVSAKEDAAEDHSTTDIINKIQTQGSSNTDGKDSKGLISNAPLVAPSSSAPNVLPSHSRSRSRSVTEQEIGLDTRSSSEQNASDLENEITSGILKNCISQKYYPTDLGTNGIVVHNSIKNQTTGESPQTEVHKKENNDDTDPESEESSDWENSIGYKISATGRGLAVLFVLYSLTKCKKL